MLKNMNLPPYHHLLTSSTFPAFGQFQQYPLPLDTRSNRGNVLQIRGFSPAVPYAERDELFYGLAATSVHNYPYYTIAYFTNESTCYSVIRLLHQRHWTAPSSSAASGTSKRLRVEFLKDNQTESRIVNAHTVCDSSLKRLIQSEQKECAQSVRNLKSQQQTSTDLQLNHNFRFPPATPSVTRRISDHLLHNHLFYHHVLLLMLKLGLHPPFDEDNLDDINLPPSPPLPPPLLKQPKDDLLASDESELEDNLEDVITTARNYHHEPKRRKLVSLKTGLVGEKAQQLNLKSTKGPKDSKPMVTTTIEEIFTPEQPKPKPKLAIKVVKAEESASEHQLKAQSVPGSEDPKPEPPLDPEPQPPASESSHFGTLIPAKLPPSPPPPPSISFDLATLTQSDLIADSALLSNCIPRPEWIHHKVFAGFKLNPACNRLYVKNLHKTTTLHDLYCLFGKFIQLDNEDHLNCFNIIKLDRGRMHGQAFVTFPSEEIAQEALKRTNGYVVHRDEQGNPRPMVVNFALSKK